MASVRDDDGNILVDVGDLLIWSNLGGDELEGVIIEMDSNVAIVELQDGSTKALEL